MTAEDPKRPRPSTLPAPLPDLTGELVFADGAARAQRVDALASQGALVVRVEGLGPAARGRLGDVLDEAIERELAARGAAAPGVGGFDGRDTSLGDQLFRARRVGASGLVLALGSLRAVGGPLEPEDSRTLRFLAAATRDRPLVLLLDDGDASLGAYTDPVALQTLLGGPRPEGDPAAKPPLARFPTRPPFERLPAKQSAGATFAGDGDAWRGWVLQLNAARGPQPLAAFERLFAHAYLPLTNALAEGLSDPRAVAAQEEFRLTFERIYSEACPTFAVTGKRPRLVLDVPEIASRTARLHGARMVHLLLVDALRFDVGVLLRRELVERLEGRASLTDEGLLWSILPTATYRQLDGLARGLDALRSAPPTSMGELDAVRGRTAEIVRRVKVGSRDLFKLDLLEARLAEAGGDVLGALPNAARDVATIITRHTQHLAPRTLLVVFGDHGFRIGPRGSAEQGGAAPEQVLVPMLSFLMGDVH